MPDKLTDKEIVKALECVLQSNNGLDKNNAIIALDLINRLEFKNCQLEKQVSEIQNANLIDLIATVGNYKSDNENLKAEVERLKNILLSFTSKVITWGNKKGYDTTELSLITILDEAKNVKAEIKAEAYKEFGERLDRKFAFYYSDTQCISAKTIRERIRNELKEMVGGADGDN